MVPLQNSDIKYLCGEVTLLRTSNKWWGWVDAQRTRATKIINWGWVLLKELENHPFRCLGEWRSIKGTNEPLHSWTAAGITWIIHFKLSRCDILTSAEQSFCDSPTLPTLNNFYKPLVTFTVTRPGLGLPPSSTSFYSQCEKRCWNNCTAKNLNRLTDYS